MRVTPRSFPPRPHFPQMPVTGLATESRPSEKTQKPRILRFDANCNLATASEHSAAARKVARADNAATAGKVATASRCALSVLIGFAMLVTFRYGASDYTDCVQKLNRLRPAGNPRALFLPKEDL